MADLGEFIGLPYSWAKTAPDGYECSTAGDSRFSAFTAIIHVDTQGRSWNIENSYQVMVKGYYKEALASNMPFHDWWRIGKGNPPNRDISFDELFDKYVDLWRIWADNHPELLRELSEKARNRPLTDKHSSTKINQACALSIILNERFS